MTPHFPECCDVGFRPTPFTAAGRGGAERGGLNAPLPTPEATGGGARRTLYRKRTMAGCLPPYLFAFFLYANGLGEINVQEKAANGSCVEKVMCK
ncbi:hypothetical protein E2C01_059285 [Portunus trituberculatus]|uniref:Uncharacterized protein n=1 Tax=Portunus trituberculatus TaxID=210409 RepID=A0A5B7H5F3_PORTR|nr:hypothetical protein [Portunus trituberculatus]